VSKNEKQNNIGNVAKFYVDVFLSEFFYANSKNSHDIGI